MVTLAAWCTVLAQGCPFPIFAAPTAEREGLRGQVKEVEVLESYFGDGDTIREDTIFMRFNKNGQMLQRNSLWQDEYPYCDYLYTGGRLDEVKNWSDFGGVTSQYSYSDDDCLEQVVVLFYQYDKLIDADTHLIQCDSLCRIVREIFRDTLSYTYDAHGNIAVFKGFDGETTYYYDADGKLTKKTGVYPNVRNVDEYTYNSHGDEESWTTTFTNGKKSQKRYEYTYDSHGNWLTRCDDDGITVRRITYYD